MSKSSRIRERAADIAARAAEHPKHTPHARQTAAKDGKDWPAHVVSERGGSLFVSLYSIPLAKLGLEAYQ